MNTQNIVNAYKLGQQFAKRNRIGRKFFGSLPIAKKLFPEGSLEYSVFICGYHSVLRHHEIWINPQTGLVTGFYFKG